MTTGSHGILQDDKEIYDPIESHTCFMQWESSLTQRDQWKSLASRGALCSVQTAMQNKPSTSTLACRNICAKATFDDTRGCVHQSSVLTWKITVWSLWHLYWKGNTLHEMVRCLPSSPTLWLIIQTYTMVIGLFMCKCLQYLQLDLTDQL